MRRRSFFHAIANAAAIVALAPQLAFRVRPGKIEAPQPLLEPLSELSDAPGFRVTAFWTHSSLLSSYYSDEYIAFMRDGICRTVPGPLPAELAARDEARDVAIEKWKRDHAHYFNRPA